MPFLCAVAGRPHSCIDFLRTFIVTADKWDSLAAVLVAAWDDAVIDADASPWMHDADGDWYLPSSE